MSDTTRAALNKVLICLYWDCPRNLGDKINEVVAAHIAALESDFAAAREERDTARARTEQVERIVKAMNKWLEDNQEDVFRRGIWDAILEAQDERGIE